MDEAELFTINVFYSKDKNEDNTNGLDHAITSIGEFQNMVSARVIKGRMLELEHSNLAGPEVKFKTVINYERTLEPNSFLGVSFRSQDGYITKPEE